MTFEVWIQKVDELFIYHVGLNRDSWPDQNYYDMFESNYTPLDAIVEAVENEYGEDGLISFGLDDYY
jgi:hypothetical protein